MREYQTKIKEVKYLTAHTVEVVVELIVPTNIQFQAGQFMELVFGRGDRCFSIINVPQEQNRELRFCVGYFPEGIATNFFKTAYPGQQLTMRGPFGTFTADDFNYNYFFIATGVGVAPFVSIIPDMLSRGFLSHIRLLFGVRSEDDIFYFDRFRHLQALYPNFSFTPLVSRPKGQWPGDTGRVTTHLDVEYPQYQDSVFYISGNREVVEEVKTILTKKGHNPDKIKVEIYD